MMLPNARIRSLFPACASVAAAIAQSPESAGTDPAQYLEAIKTYADTRSSRAVWSHIFDVWCL